MSSTVSGRENREEIEKALKGTTLKIYYHLLEKGENRAAGIREIQRDLHFSSPRLVAYHLERLERLGLVENRSGDYFLIKEIKTGVLKYFLRIGSVLLPRFLIYATFFTTLLIYALATFDKANRLSFLMVAVSFIGSRAFLSSASVM